MILSVYEIEGCKQAKSNHNDPTSQKHKVDQVMRPKTTELIVYDQRSPGGPTTEEKSVSCP